MDFNQTLDKLNEGEIDPYKKYPKALFPKTKAENMRKKAKDRLERMKKKKENDYDLVNNLGSPVGSSANNNY